MALSAEAMALRRSNKYFKDGVDPDSILPILYGNYLLTQDERAKVRLSTLTVGEKLDELFTVLERRVSVNPQHFHSLLEALRSEPALVGVADKMQGLYDEEKGTRAHPSGAGVVGSGQQQQQPPAPQPTLPQNGSSRGLRTPTQEELMENVMIPKWYLFALNLLKGDDQTVNMIDSDPALPRIPDKLKEVYRVWLETSEDPTWNTIATTLRKVKNIKMARAIEKDFC